VPLYYAGTTEGALAEACFAFLAEWLFPDFLWCFLTE